MDPSALLELAQSAFPRVTDIAMRLGVETKIPIYARLGCELCVLTEELNSPSSPDQEELLQRRIGKLLREIEKVSTVSMRIPCGVH